MNREKILAFSITVFVVMEILSMIFNPFFLTVHVFDLSVNVNFSILFFCLGFFVVDVVFDLLGSKQAGLFFSLKIASQLTFIFLGVVSIHILHMENTVYSDLFNESVRVFFYGAVAYYFSSRIMAKTMDHLKKTNILNSIFIRYFFSTVPSEVIFSLIFTVLSFRKDYDLISLLGIFISSSAIKICLSALFSVLISMISAAKIFVLDEMKLNGK